MTAEPVLGVLSGCGGAGASTFAAVLAGCAPAPAFLLDCDPLSGGIDVLLGAERVPGPRWSQVRLRGGPLDPEVLLDTLPQWRGVRFLAADTPADIDENALKTIIEAASAAGLVVLDLPRSAGPARSGALAMCDLAVLVTPAEVRALTAAAIVAPALDPGRDCLVLRGTSRAIPADHIATLLGLPALAELPYDPAGLNQNGLQLQGIRRRTRKAAATVLAEAHGRRSRPIPPAGIAA
jgi:secretion/DNA translocation related CpaE-like protein